MVQNNLTAKLQTLRQSLEDLDQTLETSKRMDKAAVKESLHGLAGQVEALAEDTAACAEPPRKDEFLSVLGHELRNSLAPILNSLHVLQLRGAADEGQRRFLDVIDRQTRHMAHLVDNLLDISRITRDKIELHKEALPLLGLVTAAVENIRPFIESRSQKLAVSPPPHTLVVEADPSRMEQVLINLLNNAAKYTDIGGQIWFSAEYQDGQAVLRVRDSGAGIAPEMLAHIFDPFGPAEGSLTRSRGGLGLGLALVQGLVRMHGGTIEAFSEGPGKGSEFVVRLPATVESEAMESAPPSEAAAEREPNLRVLVIEDNKDTASTLGVILKLWGHEIEIAYNGHAGLNAARQFRPDVVLLDIDLPGIDGYEVAKSIRQYPELDPAVIVAITGYGQPEDQARSREAGINYHYTKPIDLPSLRKLLAASARKSAV